MNDSIHELTISDYDEVYRLWEQTEGLNLEEGHSREGIDILKEKGLWRELR